MATKLLGVVYHSPHGPSDTYPTGFKSLSAGQGTWQVFHAPHIESMSSFMGVKFNPIRYHLEGNALISNVKFEVPFLGTGWLSASGTMDMKNADDGESKHTSFYTTCPAQHPPLCTCIYNIASPPVCTHLFKLPRFPNLLYETPVEIHFDKFWIDMGDRLRSQVAEADIQDPISKTIMQLGRASFFPQFATFPVLYLDQDFCVFKFPPLNTSIAVRRVLALPPVSSANQ